MPLTSPSILGTVSVPDAVVPHSRRDAPVTFRLGMNARRLERQRLGGHRAPAEVRNDDARRAELERASRARHKTFYWENPARHPLDLVELLAAERAL